MSAVLSGLLYSAGSEAQLPPAPAEDSIVIEWDYRPPTIDDLTSESEAVVEGYVTGVRSGEPLPGDSEGSPGIQTRTVSIHVTDVVAGDAPQEIQLFQLGSHEDEVETDPAYQVGEKYLLFVRRRMSDGDPSVPNPDGTWIATAPDGRLERSGGEVNSFIDGPVTDQLDGVDIETAIEQVDPSLVAPSPPDQTALGASE